ncbi:MAG TPA: hypothetical protein DCO83_14600 [Mucilaginibacter sp.]|jgi:hypothetical protein|nr:hypothetical protein [Mucilaginibacter sp.]
MSKKKTAIDPEEIHTAITTWSGYIYQGKVALYHVLTLLATDNSASAYQLQLDSMEDFAVFDATGKCLSLHQIKAVKSTYYSRYSSDFQKLCAKATKFSCADYKFHLSVTIRDKTIFEIETAHPSMKIYKYSDGATHCKLKDIDKLIETAIGEIYKKQIGSAWKTKPDYLRITRNMLENAILAKVINIHQIVQDGTGSQNFNAFHEKIPFTVFDDILKEDLNVYTTNDDYFYGLLRADLNIYYQEFCLECDEPVDPLAEKKMYSLLCFLNSLDKDGLLKFMRKIMPQRTFMLNTIADYHHHNTNTEEMKDAFFAALYEFREIENLDSMPFGWSESPGFFLVPTTINRQQQKAADVCEAIIENIMQTDLDLPYQTSNLITSQIDVESVLDTVPKVISMAGPEDDDDNPETSKIMRWKKISLTSINMAKTIIK